MCFYCHKDAETRNQQNIEFQSFENIVNLHVHWKTEHGPLKFQFIAIGVAACFHCDKVDTFQKLQKHHRLQHETEEFIVVDQQMRSNCGLCQKSIESPSKMAKHFERVHQPYSFNGVFNPICLTQNVVDSLRKLGPDGKFDKSSKLEHFQCGWCRSIKYAEVSTLEQHLKGDAFSFTCSKNCEIDTKEIEKLIRHVRIAHPSADLSLRLKNEFKDRLKRIYFRSKLLFSNGLVLFKQNVSRTSFDDFSEFTTFIERFANQKFDEHINPIRFRIPLRDDRPSSQSNSLDTENASSAKIEFFKNELSIQKRFFRDICISEVFGIDSNEDVLMEFFLELCKVIRAHISSSNVSCIKMTKMGIIITMVEYDKKKEVLRAWDGFRNADNFEARMRSFKNQFDQIDLTDLSIEAHYSHFFKPLYREAEIAKNERRINSFWFAPNGLNVRVSLKDKPVIIWTKSDLKKLTQRNNRN